MDPVYGLIAETKEGIATPLPGGWRVAGEHEGLGTDVASVFRDREGSLWVGRGGAGLDRLVGEGQWESWTTADGFSNSSLWGMTEDSRHRLWIGSKSSG